MFLLFIGGVETSSSQIISAIGGTGPSLWESSLLWATMAGALGLFLATNAFSAGGFSFTASRESVMSFFAGGIFIVFVADMFSIVSKVGSSTGTCDILMYANGCPMLMHTWEYWVIWALIVPLMAGFAISLIQFVGGSD